MNEIKPLGNYFEDIRYKLNGYHDARLRCECTREHVAQTRSYAYMIANTVVKVGDTHVVHAGAPGIGKWVYEITKVSDNGDYYGKLVSDTIRELTPEEVR